MKKLSVVLFSVLAFAVTAFAGPYDAWSNYRTVTINTTADGGGADIATSLSDFPVLVRLSDADAAAGADVLAEALAGGADIRFADATGEVALPFEIDHWSATSAAIWVRVPEVAGNSETDIRLYWGNDHVVSASNGMSVFNTNNRYRAVWHLNETASPARDAASFGTDAVWMNTPEGAAGNIGGAINIANPNGTSAANGKYLRAAYNTANDNFKTNATDGLTVSAWVNRTSNNGDGNQAIAGRWSWSSGNVRQYIIEANASSWQFAVSQTGTNAEETVGNTPVVNGEWVNVTATYRSGEQTLYVNGLARDTRALTPYSSIDSAWSHAPFLIGRMQATNNCCLQGIDARIDEVRLADTTRSPDWIKLGYETQKAGATAVSLGASETQTSTFAYANLTTVYVVDSEISLNTPTVNGAVLDISVSPALPAGLTLDPVTGTISGTPTAATAEDVYTVTAVFSEPDLTVTADLTITVNPLAPTDLVYPVTDVIYGLDNEIDENVPTVNSLTDPNQLVANFSISPALPAGLVIDEVTGVISGTPTEASGEKTYTVTASNVTGSTTAQLTMAVTPPITSVTYRYSTVTYGGGIALPIESNTPTADAIVQSWEVSPALPAGLSLDPETGVISGTPTASASGDYTVTATNPAGSQAAIVNITVVLENYGNWSASQILQLNTSAINVASEQTNFPVLVRLTADHAAVFAAAAADGADIRFSTLGGAPLAYELGHWNQAGQSAAIWVNLPTIDASGITQVVMHWGNAAAVSLSEGSRVFHTDNDFLGVWHLGNASGSDPRPNAVHPGLNDAVPSGEYLDTWEPRQGLISGADSLRTQEGAGWQNNPFHPGQLNSDHISLGVIDFPNAEVTSQFWLYYPTPQTYTGWTHFITHGNDRTNTNFWIGRVDNSSTLRGRGAHNGESNPDNIADVQNVFNTYADQWAHVAVTRDGDNGRRWRIYVNGNKMVDAVGGNATHDFVPGVRQHNYIGMGMWPDRNPQIKVEEYRLSSVARSADWLKLEYETQKANAIPLYGLSYPEVSYTVVEETPITPIAVAGLTGTAERFSISPALPPSLTLNTETGEITGTPDNGLASQTYTVTAHSGAWSTSTTFDLEITALPPTALAYADEAPSYQVGIELVPNVPTYSGTITSWSIDPMLPSGLGINPSTGVISGTPLVVATEDTYTIEGTGPQGDISTTLTFAVAPPEEDFMADWPQFQDITLNTSATGAEVEGDAHGFPVLVRLGAAEAAIMAAAGENGASLRFTKANNVTRLPHEIVSWDAGNNTAEIWVLVDTVYGNNSDQHVRMFWGNATAIDRSSGEAVFDTAAGFQAVWHMDAASGDEPDATGNEFAATQVNEPGSVKGMVGNARAFDGVDQHFQVANSANSVLSFPVNGNYTISTWVLFDPTGGNNDNRTIVSKHDNEYALSLNGSGGNNWQYFQYADGWQTISSPRAANVWTHLVVVKDGAASRLFVNGAQTANTTTGSNPNGRNTGTDVSIGKRGDNNTRHWRGYIDELRMATASRSAAWIKLDYASQKTYQTLTNIGLQPPAISYTADTLKGTAGLAVTAQTPTISGPVGSALVISPALPDGMSFDETTGEISGTPTVVYGPADHTITASNAGGSSSDVVVVQIVAPPAPPAPVIVSPTNNATGVTIHPLVVSWETVAAPVTHYQLQGTEDATFMDIHVDTIVADTFFVAHDAPHDRELHVRVRAVNVGGEGPWTAITFRTIEAPPSISYDPDTVNYPLVTAITPLEVTADPDSGPATSFSITPELPAGLDFDTETGTITGTPTAVTEATDYTVIASGPGGFDTTLVRIAVIPVAPGVVTNVEATAGVSQASVAFTAPAFDGGAAITSYTVTSNPGNISASGPGSPIEVTGLTAGVSYTFTVTATNSAGTGIASDTSAPVVPYNVPGAPTAVAGQAGNAQVAVSWTAPASDSGSAITAYTVTSDPEGVTCTTIDGVTTDCLVEGLTNGTDYTFTVTATNEAGTGAASEPSATLTPSPDPTAPTAPRTVVGTPGNEQVTVAWVAPLTDGDSVITSYTVTATPGGETCVWTTGDLTCTVANLTNGTPYTFTVTATNGVGTSPASVASEAVTPRTVPDAPTAVIATAGALSAEVAFAPPVSDGGSPVITYTVTAHPGDLTGTGTTSPVTVSGLTAGTDYRFTVVATNAAGDGLASDTSDAVTPYTVPDAPTDVAAEAGNAEATVTFTASASDGGAAITGYTVTAQPGDITETGTESPITVTGLTNGTAYTFTVQANNAAGASVASDASNEVTPNAPPAIAYANATISVPALVSADVAAPENTGGPVVSWSVTPALPDGLSLNTETGEISGTPTDVAAAADYKVAALGALGTDTAIVNLAVVANPPVIAYDPATVSFTLDEDIDPPALESTGGPVTTWSITPALPAGLEFNTETGAFSGTPTAVAAAADYKVAAVNITGSDTVIVNITVLPGLPVITYSGSPKSFIKGEQDSLLVTSTGGTVASYAVSPALPAGLTLNTTTGRISGTPTAASAAANYTVTATNASGTATTTVNITVVDMTPVIAYTPTTLSYTRAVAITNLTPASTGGAVDAYTAVPALPAGLTLNGTSGVISGTPTAATAAANYRIIGTNDYGKDTVTLNITVLPGLPVIAYSGSPKTFIKGVADSLLVASTGGAVASYAVAPALPAGLTLNTTTGRIAGTPTGASAAANYTVTATNASGSATATVNIKVDDLTPIVSYEAVTDSFTVGIEVTRNATSTGGAVTEWTVTPALPAGLTLGGTTGHITGTPTAPSAAANYTVIAKNAYGADTVVLNLKVIPSTAIMGGAYTFRVSGVEKPYTFVLPAGAATTEKVTMLITDVTGRTIWTRSVRPNANGAATEVTWTGRTSKGMLASAGMYVVRISVLDNGKTTEYVRKSVTLKSR